jgi:hypothetical protein
LAGLGRKEFNSGDILLASEVQGYLQDQAVMVFDDATARGSAIPSPSEGMLTYNKDTDQLELYDGSAFGPVGSDSGLIHIETRTVSAVSAENFNNVFTSTFENYKVIIDLTVAVGASVSLDCRLRVGGSDNSTSNYVRQLLSASATTISATRVSSSNTFAFGNIGTNKSITIVDFFSPEKTSRTQTLSNNSLNGDTMVLFNNGFNATTSFDGFTLFPASSTISGKVFIYGYKD